MDKKELFRAIDTCEDTFIKETAEDIQKRKPSVIQRFFFVNSSENAEKDMKKLSFSEMQDFLFPEMGKTKKKIKTS